MPSGGLWAELEGSSELWGWGELVGEGRALCWAWTLCSSHKASLWALEHAWLGPATGPLHLQFSCLEHSSPDLGTAWVKDHLKRGSPMAFLE